jgi:hypothetical protein
VFVHPGVPLTLVAAALADCRAGLEERRDDVGVVLAWRLMTPAVATHTSAQSRQSRTHLTISATFSSLGSQPVSAMHAWAQSLSASIVAASRPASTLKLTGQVPSICLA